MAIPKLTLVPDLAGYQVGDPQDVLSAKLEGGGSRYRLDLLDPAVPVSVQWTLTRDRYDYLQSFIALAINRGADPFYVDLKLNGSTLQECFAHFVPGTRRATPRGPAWLVTADLEVMPMLSPPMRPVILPVQSPSTADTIPVTVRCDWLTQSIALYLDGALRATLAPTGLLATYDLVGVADGVHSLTAKATNTNGDSALYGPVNFNQTAAAASGTLDPAECFDIT